MIETELITHAHSGDETAWETLVGQYQEAAFRLAYLLMGDADEAKDVAQEAFIRAFRALGRFDTSRPFRPWLLSIVTNLARNRQRAIGRYLAALRRVILTEPEATTNDQHETGDKRQTHILWQAVQKLNPNDREIIYLRYFMELAEAETAAILEIAPGTVKSRLHRALKRLQDLVEREFPALREEYEG